MSKPNQCDPATGECRPSDLPGDMNHEIDQERRILYVGDPMCSWCWGISPELKKLRDHYALQGIGFQVIVGGLRPGAGESWDENMKNMLRHHWKEVNRRSGQPFGYDLLDRDIFNYDTEPACRAVVAFRHLKPDMELEFFEEIQRKFYVESKDPGQLEFYEDLCTQFQVPYPDFTERFNSDEITRMTWYEFRLNRQWGVRGYPTVLFQQDANLYLVAGGYTDFFQMNSVIEQIQSKSLIV